MIYTLDTEFIEDGKTIELISIGIVAEDGREFYAEVPKLDWSNASQWVMDNVRPNLWHLKSEAEKIPFNKWIRDGGVGGLLSRNAIRHEIREFIDRNQSIEFWSYYGDYDWVALCQLFGTMIDLPEGYPMYCRDLKQEIDRLGLDIHQDDSIHNALEDARWIMKTLKALQALKPKELE